jgi:hypothetical protein
MRVHLLALLSLLAACQKPLNEVDAGILLTGDVVDAGVNAKLAAVAQVANTDADCRKLGDFVWLIGDARGTLGGQQFGKSITPNTSIKLASATKWLFGAYVAERFQSDPASIDWEAMRMRSGYVDLNYSSCLFTDTVEGCANAGNNEHHTAAEDGFFYYGGGHFQQYALTLGLGALGDDSLAAELSSRLGSDLHLGFNSPQLAGGGQMAPSGYATFLTRIVSGALTMRTQLGANPVCTNPDTCSTAHSSPAAGFDWHYSLGHWVEDEPGGDGAFSSAGAFGTYPWIDAQAQSWGLLARYDTALTAAMNSAVCGRKLRAAWLAAP